MTAPETRRTVRCMAAKRHPDKMRVVLRFARDPQLLANIKSAAKKAGRPVAAWVRDTVKRALEAA